MSSVTPTRIVCIVPRLGASVGGGKMNAVFKRMNLLVARNNTEVVLLNMHHGVNQKIAFADLMAKGVFDPRITHASLFEFCVPEGHHAEPPPDAALPAWDTQITKTGTKTRVSYFQDDTLIMRETSELTCAGKYTVRQILTDPSRETRLKYIDDALVESLTRFGDGIVEKTFYSQGQALCSLCRENRAFVYADNAVLGKRYRNENTMHKALVDRAFPPDCIVFVDGITTAYLSRHITAKKVLFLHADHRAPTGGVVPRSRYLIEHFDGNAIVTATQVHKRRLETETKHAAPIRVIPHYTEVKTRSDVERQHICTVSRLELVGKPIHHCIEAFTRIMHLIPQTNYLIYGSGLGHERLSQLISHTNCEDRVFLKGYTNNAIKVFEKSLFSLAPTMTEGFGLALLESLSCQCPVISYDVDYGPRELIQPGQNGELINPGDIDGIAQAILKVHKHRARYATACKVSADRYSFEHYKQNYHTLIDDLAGRDFSFDVSARDLKLETKRALSGVPHHHKARLLDLYIKLCADSRDVEGMYEGFQQKLALFPQVQRPLMRCIWLSRRLGRLEECRAFLALFEQRFPVNHSQFVTRYPNFLEIVDTLDDA